jgi:hypothetical protein
MTEPREMQRQGKTDAGEPEVKRELAEDLDVPSDTAEGITGGAWSRENGSVGTSPAAE